MGDRSRSRSPRRDEKRRDEDNDHRRSKNREDDRKSKGFKWKEKRKDDTNEDDRQSGLRYKDRKRAEDKEKERLEKSKEERESKEEKEKKEKKEKKKKAKPQEAMIIVNVNDRLGTKAAVPCLPSDTIGDFKKIVAAMIGRQPYEIMLKRQSERPFKDMLTLEDYGISNGVQLDLEVDTGD